MSFTTHFSILEGVRNNHDFYWERFYRMYAPLIRLHGHDCGIRADNMEDLIQDVLVSLCKKMGNFVYNPFQGRFRDYLRKIIRARAADMLRAWYKHQKLPMPECDYVLLDQCYDEEWREHIKKLSMQQLRSSISLRHFQIFILLDIQNYTIHEVAKLYHVPESTIYSIRKRTEMKIKNIAAALSDLE